MGFIVTYFFAGNVAGVYWYHQVYVAHVAKHLLLADLLVDQSTIQTFFSITLASAPSHP